MTEKLYRNNLHCIVNIFLMLHNKMHIRNNVIFLEKHTFTRSDLKTSFKRQCIALQRLLLGFSPPPFYSHK